MCRGATARDNIDGAAIMQRRLRYQLFSLDENSNSVRICPPANPSEGKAYKFWRGDPRYIDYDEAGRASDAAHAHRILSCNRQLVEAAKPKPKPKPKAKSCNRQVVEA